MTSRPRHMSSLRKLATWAREQQKQQARASRVEERRRKEAERQNLEAKRQQHEIHVQRQHGNATKKTFKVEQRVQKLTTILLASIAEPIHQLDFEQLKTPVKLPPLELGTDEHPDPPPQWEDFAPSQRAGLVGRVVRREKYQRELATARGAFERAQREYEQLEEARRERIAEAVRVRDEARTDDQRAAAEHNREIDEFADQTRHGDRHAASRYFQLVLDRITGDPSGFPKDRRAAYAPESSTVTIEWLLPRTEVVPPEKEYRYSEEHDEIIVHKWRTSTEIRDLYHSMAAQIALRAANHIFAADPNNLVESVIFNGVVEEVGERTGRKIRPCVLTMCATRDKFKRLKLHDISDPVEVVRKQFGARLSSRPDDLLEVPALRPFVLADPDVIEVVEHGDARPDLLSFTPSDLELFLAVLLDRMGLDAERFEPSGDNGVDCIATDPAPQIGGTVIVHAKLYQQAVPPSEVRALHGLVSKHSAISGILLTTSGFHPASLGFAKRRNLQLHDGQSFLALCHQHRMPARIGDVANICTPTQDPLPTQIRVAKPADVAQSLNNPG